MKTKRLILSLGLFLFLTSCQKKDESISDQESQTQKAMQLLEKDQFEEAIVILKSEQAKVPTDRVRTLLASAYAARAGIKVESYWGTVIGYESLISNSDMKDSGKLKEEISIMLPGLPEEAKKALKNIEPDLITFQKIRRRIESIPSVNVLQRTDLLLALETLQEVASPGARLYRAILGIIVLKSSLDESDRVIRGAVSAERSICAEQIQLGIRWLSFNYQILQGTLFDISQAFPSQKNEIENIKRNIGLVDADLPQKTQLVMGLLCSK